jgi:transketolase
LVPDEVAAFMRERTQALGADREAWAERLAAWKQANPELDKRWDDVQTWAPPEGWEDHLPTFPADAKGMATRAASGKVIEALFMHVPQLVGGSADLTPSNKTRAKEAQPFSDANPEGRYVHFGVREHGMGAILNGMTLHGLRGFGGTFLIFSDYHKPAVRLSALMGLPVTWVYTHDSIGLGEDGPTHQPIEQLAGLRAIPHLRTFRPADANETAEAWRLALAHTAGPSALALTRQNLPTLDRSTYGAAEGTRRGAYVLADTDGTPDVILMGTGSEVHLALEAREALAQDGIAARVVSMPCWELFREQDQGYRDAVLPPAIRARVAVEAASALGWHEWVGLDGAVVALDRFGASAPFEAVYEHLGITADAVAKAARGLLQSA